MTTTFHRQILVSSLFTILIYTMDNDEVDTLALDWWVITFGTTRGTVRGRVSVDMFAVTGHQWAVIVR